VIDWVRNAADVGRRHTPFLSVSLRDTSLSNNDDDDNNNDTIYRAPNSPRMQMRYLVCLLLRVYCVYSLVGVSGLTGGAYKRNESGQSCQNWSHPAGACDDVRAADMLSFIGPNSLLPASLVMRASHQQTALRVARARLNRPSVGPSELVTKERKVLECLRLVEYSPRIMCNWQRNFEVSGSKVKVTRPHRTGSRNTS